MRKDRISIKNNNRTNDNHMMLELDLEISSGNFKRQYKYTINNPSNINKELPPAPPNSCILEQGIHAATESSLVSNSQNICSPGANYQNLNTTIINDNISILDGIKVQGVPAQEFLIKVLSITSKDVNQVILSGPSLDNVNLLSANEIIYNLSQDGTDLLLINSTMENERLNGDIIGNGSVSIADIMALVNHIMEIQLLTGENLEYAIKFNEGNPLISISTIMKLVTIIMNN